MRHVLVTSLALAVSLAAAGSASALERSGTTTIDFDGRKIVQNFSTNYDPAAGTFKTSGTLTLPTGRQGSYSLSGICHRETRSCDLTGSGVGPLGNAWNGTGFVKRAGDKTTLTATLVGPGGRTVKIDREVTGDALLPNDF